MKRLLCILCMYGLFAGITQAQELTNPDKTLSPYFWVKSNNSSVDELPLKHTSADVKIAGVIAQVRVRQVYVNEGKNVLEAIYIFPASTRAAVYAMHMNIGKKKLIAKVEEKQKARQQYEQAKQEGKTASLLEQQNPNVFQMNVANILPKDSITVELFYTELLVPTESVYEFVYPTVVGPRYSEKPELNAQTGDKWVANPYLNAGKKAPYTFDIRAVIQAGMPLQEVVCNTHKTQIKFDNITTSSVSLDKSETDGGNRDYILKYRLAGGKVQTGIVLHEGLGKITDVLEASTDKSAYISAYKGDESENFFLLMMQPPKAPQNDQIPPREYVFVVDVSGSMHGYPLEVSKRLLRNLIGKLRKEDRFNVLLFESSNAMLYETSVPCTTENIEKALKVIDNQSGGGGTRLLPALQKALSFQGLENYARTFLVVTDGYVSVEQEAFDLIRNNLNKANLFAFGIGSSVNRYLIEGMARVGMGEPFIATGNSDADAVAEKFRKYIENPVLTNVTVQYSGFTAYDLDVESIPTVFAERPIVVTGKYKGKPTGIIIIKGISGGNTFEQVLDLSTAQRGENEALRYLWARNQVALLDDYNRLGVSYYSGYSRENVQNQIDNNPNNKARIAKVTAIGLKYNLLTAYTSFIAVDDEVRNTTGNSTTVKQPLPMPQNVSDRAIKPATSPQYSNSLQENIVVGYSKKSRNKTSSSGYKNKQKDQLSNSGGEKEEVVAPPSMKAEPADTKDGMNDIPFLVVEQMPEYKGGMEKLKEFIEKNVKYPATATLEGKVFVNFEVNPDGTVGNVTIAKGLGKEFDEEAMRVIKLTSGNWEPRQLGRPPIKYTIPVVFKR